MSITHEAYLNIVPGDSPAPIIKVSQYDADFSIVFHLIAKKRGIVPAYPRAVENDEDVTINVPTSATVSVRGTKTDGNGYSANATLSGTATAPIVTVAGHEQMTASAGVNVYEITFYADNATKRLSTANFILFVEPAALDASTITSESLMLELNDLIAAVPNAVAAADRAEAAVQSVEGVTTQVATNTQDISDIKADLSEIVPGLSDEAKAALLDCFAHVAWISGDGMSYYNALQEALYNDIILPEGFVKNKYIESTGEQYITTSLESAIPMELEIELSFTQVESGIFFGGSNGGNSRFFLLGTQQYDTASTGFYFSNRFSDTNFDKDGRSRAWLALTDFELVTNKKYTVKSGIVSNQTNVTTYIESDGYRTEANRKIPTVGYPIILGGDFWGSSTFKGLKGKIYRCKIKSGDTTVFDGIPCKRDADNKYGLYDIVNNVFYASSGSSDYLGGEN